MARSSTDRSVLHLLELAWSYIDDQVSPYLSAALLDIGLTYLRKNQSNHEKLQDLVQLTRLEAEVDSREEWEAIKEARKRLEKELLDQGGWRSWLAGAWVVAAIRTPWSLFVTLSVLVSVPMVIAIYFFR
jgi:hypothetical protein